MQSRRPPHRPTIDKPTMALRIAQYSTKHAHHVAVARAMRDCPLMTFVGVWEPDPSRREEVLTEADSPYTGLTWFGSLEEMLGDESIEAVACEGANDESLDQAEQIVAVLHVSRTSDTANPSDDDHQ